MPQYVAIISCATCPPQAAQPSQDGCFVSCYLTHKVAALATLCGSSAKLLMNTEGNKGK